MDEAYLRQNKWSVDRGKWIYNGDTSCAFSLDMAIKRQRAHDAAEAKAAETAKSLREVPSIR